MGHSVRLGALLAATLLMALPARAQQTATGVLVGRVTDETGMGLPGTRVTVVRTAFGAETDAEGNYRITGLPPGGYSVTATYFDVQSVTTPVVRICPGRTVPLDVEMSWEVIGADPKGLLDEIWTRHSFLSNDEWMGAIPATKADSSGSHGGSGGTGATSAVAPRDPTASTGTLLGYVMDAACRPLPRATVTVEGTALSVVADDEGGYKMLGVPLGTYDVTASLAGYQPAVFGGVNVSGSTPPLSFLLTASDAQGVGGR